ncbi:MAG TPA: penicillin acylase family protein [Streptosporangiaceae bacterium]|nr:penicillin acylase family protein [Streptosporangiaceae bacterium]
MRNLGRTLNIIAAACACVVVLALLGFGYKTIPALGPALDPGLGVWTSAEGGEPVRSQTLDLAGLQQPVTVSFSKQGVASIEAATDHDVFLALGYVHAEFRLAEMDEERRLGEGRLAQLAGPSDLASDKFELRLGLLRTAQQEWAQLPKASPAAQALLAYAQGVNDDLARVRASGQWPAAFSLAGVYPGPWTPVDSLVIQGELTQELDFTTTPLDYALLERSLGAKRTMAWFPVIAPDAQEPYDPGPYARLALTPLGTQAAGGGPKTGTTARSAEITAGEARAAAALLAEVSHLPDQNQVHEYPESNAWAANGPAVQAKGALLAGDPHLPLTLPSVWYEAALSAPGLDVAGVTVPGVPAVLIGHNEHIAWSLTDTQNQATLFYEEKTRGDQYYWDGAWRTMQVVHYEIPVRGAATVRLTVDLTVHGPIMTQAGQTTSVDWMGNVPSPDLASALAVYHATDFAQFKAALATWYAPSQNFVYADTAGNIGAISPGYYPQVPAACQPWLPMSGTGGCDVTGVIPYAAVPQVYDPPSHVVATANQRPVSAAYPYYIGTSANFFDPGYRAATIYNALLTRPAPLTPASFAALQASLTDQLAVRLVPKLLTALQGTRLSSAERNALTLLGTWHDSMTERSQAAALWWTFLGYYLSDTFQPWWTHARVPVSKDSFGLDVTVNQVSLVEDLEAWTLHDPANPAFSLPSGRPRTAPQVMRTAFASAVGHLAATLGGTPASWAWGRLHSRAIPALSGAGGLGYGPRAAGGDPFTPDAADGGPVSSDGPSWRMIVTLSAAPGISAEGVYPGGQSENPASPWYDNLVPLWWDGAYLPVPAPGRPAGALTWILDVAGPGG